MSSLSRFSSKQFRKLTLVAFLMLGQPAISEENTATVDQSTFLGWRTFHSLCHGCHAVDATGTSVAPNLVNRLKDMDYEEFVSAVLDRYRITFGLEEIRGDDQTALREAFRQRVLKHERGELIMPDWDRDPNVKPHVEDLYKYLKARADGKLPPGRPQKQKD